MAAGEIISTLSLYAKKSLLSPVWKKFQGHLSWLLKFSILLPQTSVLTIQGWIVSVGMFSFVNDYYLENKHHHYYYCSSVDN